MLRSLRDIEGYVVSASDGEIGKVADFLLDDERWVIRYLVVKTAGSFSPSRREVLVSPIFFRQADWTSHQFRLALTVEKVRNSPSVDAHKPVSRQHEKEYYRYFGYPNYWEYSGFWGMSTYPRGLAPGQWNEAAAERCKTPSGDGHLRSDKEIRGYHIEGSDRAVGHLRDCIVDDEMWKVRYLVVDTASWWLGKSVLIAPHWANKISWSQRKIFVDLSRQKIKESPEWNAETAINREYEERLYDYYGRPVDWAPGGVAEKERPELR
ncbi:MAG: PRC-barrel domain-containing protein [Polyangia bacterium]